MKINRRSLLKGLLATPLAAVVGIPTNEPDYGPVTVELKEDAVIPIGRYQTRFPTAAACFIPEVWTTASRENVYSGFVTARVREQDEALLTLYDVTNSAGEGNG